MIEWKNNKILIKQSNKKMNKICKFNNSNNKKNNNKIKIWINKKKRKKNKINLIYLLTKENQIKN